MLITTSFELLPNLALGDVTNQHSFPIILPGNLPERITVETLQKFILLGIAEETLHVSTNLIYASYNIDTKRDAIGAAVFSPDWACTDIFVLDDSGGADFSIGGYGSIIQVFCYDISGTFISSPSTSPISGGVTFSVPAGTKNISFNISDSGETTFPSLQLNQGSVLLAYEAPNYYFLKIKTSALVDYYTKTEVDAIVAAIVLSGGSEIGLQVGTNKLNPYTPEDTVWILADGTEGFYATALSSIFIPVLPSTQYTLSGLEKASGDKNLAYYDSNKDLIGGATFTASGSGAMADFTFTTGAGTHFIKVQLRLDAESYAAGQLEQAATSSSFVAYEQMAITVNGVPTTFGTGGGGATDLTMSRDSTTVTINSSTGNDAIIPVATSLLAGILTAADKVKLNSLDVANLTLSRNATTVTIVSNTGTNAVIPIATRLLAGILTANDKKALSYSSAKIVDFLDASDISGVADGADLSGWPNKTGGNNADTTGTNKPNYLASANGMPAVNFTGASSESMLCDFGEWQDMIIVLQSNDGASFLNYGGIVSKFGGAGADFALYADGVGGSSGLNVTGGGVITVQGFSSSNNEFGNLIKHKILRVSMPSAVAATTMRIGGFWNIAGRYWNGQIQEIRTYDSVLTKEEFQTAFAEITRKYKLQRPIFLRTDGNSIMIGGYAGVTTAQSCGNLLNGYFQSYFNNKVDFLNVAVGGRTGEQCDAAALVPPGLDFQMYNRVINGIDIIYLLPFTNEIPGSGDGLIAWGKALTYARNRIKNNESVLVFIISPISCLHTGGTPKISETERQIVITEMNNFIPEKGIQPLMITHSDLNDVNACDNTTFYDTDRIHPNATGQALLASEVFKLSIPFIRNFTF